LTNLNQPIKEPISDREISEPNKISLNEYRSQLKNKLMTPSNEKNIPLETDQPQKSFHLLNFFKFY